MSEPRTSVLGGETGKRSLFGLGRGADAKKYAGGAVFVMCVVYIMVQSTWVLWVGIPVLLFLFVASRPSPRGTMMTKLNRRRRWLMRQFNGKDQYEPYTDETWEKAKAVPGWFARRKATGAVRQMPDMADGLGWLQSAPESVGILWQKPTGEDEFASIVFEVEGKIAGMETADRINASTEKWCRFLEGYGGESSLARRVQTMTRVLPPDTTPHEAWVGMNLDKDSPRILQESYAEALEEVAQGALVQRHYVVISWPLDKNFRTAAARYGKGKSGWRRLLEFEGKATYRSLMDAGMGDVIPLTARQIAAILAHLQDPARFIDQVSDVDPINFGIPSQDMRSYTTTTAPWSPFSLSMDEDTPAEGATSREWFHATCLLLAENFEVQERYWSWLMPYLSDMGEPIIRTLTFHMEIVPAYQAKAEARRDLVMDEADLVTTSERGKMANDESMVARESAERRVEELRSGSSHHGVRWFGAVTITAMSADDLRRHARIMTEYAQIGLGIRRLEWLDTQQSGAMGLTAPLGRGLIPRKATVLDRVESVASRTDSKEVLV